MIRIKCWFKRCDPANLQSREQMMSPTTFRSQSQFMLIVLFLIIVQICGTLHDLPSKTLLEGLLRKAAGIFVDPLRQVGLERTVLVTGCNHGFLNHLLNFKCFADRLGLKFIVVAMDENAYQYLTKHTNMVTYYMPNGVDNTSLAVTSDSVTFRSKQFNLITARKKEAVHDILVLGYDVLFSDTDVAIVRNPLPYLMWKNVDYVHSLNAVCRKEETWDFQKSKEEGNTGFYFVRSNRRTIKLWADAFAAVPKFRDLDDQAVFWNVIRRSSDPPVYPLGSCRHVLDGEQLKVPIPPVGKDIKLVPMSVGGDRVPLVTCVLDSCIFSSGMISRIYLPEYTYDFLLENLGYRNETVCTLHANYIKGNHNKAKRMEEHGYWLISQPDSDDKKALSKECVAFAPTAGNFSSKFFSKGTK